MVPDPPGTGRRTGAGSRRHRIRIAAGDLAAGPRHRGGSSRPGMPCASASPTSRPRDRTCWPRAWRPRLSSNSHWRMETGGSASPISTTPTATGCASIRSAPIEIRDRVRRGNSGCGAPCSGESRHRRRRRRQARTAPGWREAPDESETGWRTSSKSSATHAAPRAACASSSERAMRWRAVSLAARRCGSPRRARSSAAAGRPGCPPACRAAAPCTGAGSACAR